MNLKTSSIKIFVAFFVLSAFAAISLEAQPLSLTREEMIQYTPLWEGARFPDGRPKVPDDIIKRMRYVTITEAWASVQSGAGAGMRGAPGRGAAPGMRRGPASTETGNGARGMRGGPAGTETGSAARRGGMGGAARGGFGRGGGSYNNQYLGTMKPMHPDVTICGRAMTIQFMPLRPDINSAISQQGRADGRMSGQYTWGIDQLQQGDVYVANVCEAILDASHVGDNLGTAIFQHSGNGAIIWGTLRDLERNKEIKGFNVFVRDFRPQSNANNMVMGVNCPLQLGYVTVMPGDIVLAKQMGIVFIPPHIAESVVVQSERSRLRDTFAHIGVREGRFTAQQADGGFTPQMNQEFTQWLRDNFDNMEKFFDDPNAAPSNEFIQQYLDGLQ
jgi:4-hydroxy-4-methyl-2-oxoglutarate aldolase